MNAIGGYFELELPLHEEYHKQSLRLNTGRNAFEYILRAKKYKKVYLPYYTCDVMLEPIHKLNLEYEFYHIDKRFEPQFNFDSMKPNEVLVYNNYFGICSKQVRAIAQQCKNVIIDNSQAFFAKPLPDVDTFYSPRKFFGIPDGAYLYTNEILAEEFETDISYKRCEHLLGRIDTGARANYNTFQHNDSQLVNQPIKKMSNLTRRLLQSIDYEKIAKQRRENFMQYHTLLSDLNELAIDLHSDDIPMVYPYLARNNKPLRQKLIQQGIFTATYWPNVHQWLANTDTLELDFHKNLIALPVDQRYGNKELTNLVISKLVF